MGGSEVVALDHISFVVPQGDYVAIMGPSGSGKSTLLNILGCLDRPTEGKYEINGIAVVGKLSLTKEQNKLSVGVFPNPFINETCIGIPPYPIHKPSLEGIL